MKIQTLVFVLMLTVLALNLVQATVLFTEDDYFTASDEQGSLQSDQSQNLRPVLEPVDGSCDHLRELCCLYGGACDECNAKCKGCC